MFAAAAKWQSQRLAQSPLSPRKQGELRQVQKCPNNYGVYYKVRPIEVRARTSLIARFFV